MYRDTIFISHATPEDNEFSIWIASRLEMLGYKTWIDKNGLLGGERFWLTIQNEIRDNAIKILLVYSNNICDKDGNIKSGIEKEISYAESIASQEGIKDFIIPLHVDKKVPFNSFIGSNRLNHIPFDDNWAEGLKMLLKKLEKDSVPKEFDTETSSFSEWYEKEYISNCSIISRIELFYTSWWQVAEMPTQFHMIKFQNRTQAETIRNINKDVPISILSNVLSTFDKNLDYCVKNNQDDFKIEPENIYSISLDSILSGFESDEFPTHRDAENHFKKFLNHLASNIFWKRGFRKSEMSNKRFAYYLPKYEKQKSVSFTYPCSVVKKKKTINGKFEDIGFWHYATSIKTTLNPFIGFSIKPHLLFSTDGFKMIDDDKKMQSYRRKKGRRFFNEEWRDMQLAFVQYLKDENGEIKIQVAKEGKFFVMKEWPEYFWSEYGYIDPNSIMNETKVENVYVDYNDEDYD